MDMHIKRSLAQELSYIKQSARLILENQTQKLLSCLDKTLAKLDEVPGTSSSLPLRVLYNQGTDSSRDLGCLAVINLTFETMF